MKTPKVFISYSWSSSGYRDLIRTYAERLVGDGIDTTLDQWDLSEGQDKYTFMEKMVTDPAVSHVLIFSDALYAQKADERRAGVGTESQIISKEVYEKVEQKKFIPVVCEKTEDGEPCLPVFLKSRIWIDFSTPEAVNQNWEKLLRALYGKPMNEKPSLGSPPSFLTATEGKPALPTLGKYSLLREALLNGRPTSDLFRKDFIVTAIGFADSLRPRQKPNVEHVDEQVLGDLHKLLPLRDQLIDWLILESSLPLWPRFDDMLIDVLERLLALQYQPPDVTSWNESWYDAQRIFIYEVFLYFIAVLIQADRYVSIRNMLTTQYLLPEQATSRVNTFVYFDDFGGYSRALAERNERLKMNRISVIADLIKERATRTDVPFRDVMQAELIVLLVSLLSSERRWYPHTLIYSERGPRFPLFLRATQRKYFERLKIITGVETADDLRRRFSEGCQIHRVNSLGIMFHGFISLPELMNMKALDTVL